MIPLGGYVQMKGQDDSNPTLVETGDDSYNTKKPWQRIIILFAGPFANFILAAILYFSIALMGAKTLAQLLEISAQTLLQQFLDYKLMMRL